MQAVQVLRFSGPRDDAAAEAVVGLAERLGCPVSVLERGGAHERWLELVLDAGPSVGSDDQQLIRSLARSIERLGVGFRLREYVTEVRRSRRDAAPAFS